MKRTDLIEMINIHFYTPVDPEIEKAWSLEAERRFAEYKRGDAKTISAEDVFENIKAKK